MDHITSNHPSSNIENRVDSSPHIPETRSSSSGSLLTSEQSFPLNAHLANQEEQATLHNQHHAVISQISSADASTISEEDAQHLHSDEAAGAEATIHFALSQSIEFQLSNIEKELTACAHRVEDIVSLSKATGFFQPSLSSLTAAATADVIETTIDIEPSGFLSPAEDINKINKRLLAILAESGLKESDRASHADKLRSHTTKMNNILEAASKKGRSNQSEEDDLILGGAPIDLEDALKQAKITLAFLKENVSSVDTEISEDEGLAAHAGASSQNSSISDQISTVRSSTSTEQEYSNDFDLISTSDNLAPASATQSSSQSQVPETISSDDH